MSLKGDLDRAKGLVSKELADLEAAYASKKASLEARLGDLKSAEKLITKEIEAVVERLGVVLGK